MHFYRYMCVSFREHLGSTYGLITLHFQYLYSCSCIKVNDSNCMLSRKFRCQIVEVKPSCRIFLAAAQCTLAITSVLFDGSFPCGWARIKQFFRSGISLLLAGQKKREQFLLFEGCNKICLRFQHFYENSIRWKKIFPVASTSCYRDQFFNALRFS